MTRHMSWFAGVGGDTLGTSMVPGMGDGLAANHWAPAIDSHEANFPAYDHWRGDIREAPVHDWPASDLFWASPECPKWSKARGKRRKFDQDRQPGLFDTRTAAEKTQDEEDARSRALMEEVPDYLEGVIARGGLVKVGVVENVVDVRGWDRWDWWIGRFHRAGYKTRLIAFNSMHAQGTRSPAAPQSRDRLYLAYWHESLRRDPDWDKWLRPRAHCRNCDRTVSAIQAWKNPKRDMGRYGQSYVYRCPTVSCRGAVVEPPAQSALTALDLTIPAPRIGDRPTTENEPEGLAPATINRIKVGRDRFWLPLLEDAVPLMVPVEGRTGKLAQPADLPGRTQTTRNETGVALPPFVIPMRGGGDREKARPIDAPLHTVTAGGNHHGLVLPTGTLTKRARYGVAAPAIEIADIRFRMLEPHEIQAAMAFPEDYRVIGSSKRIKVRLLGNAVTPCVAEVIVSALVETLHGEDLERREWTEAA